MAPGPTDLTTGDLCTDGNHVKRTTEAEGLETQDREWRARPLLARLARLTILAVPFIAVTATAWKLNSLLGEPATLLEAVARWAALSVVSTLALVSIDRVARQYLPLSTLLQLSVVFPDQAPSRFKMALRKGTAKNLAREVAELENASAQEAAEYLLQVVGRLTAHDRLTRGHTERVRAYADLVAVEMGFTPEERMKLQWAGLLHDIGKLTVPTEVLNKSTRLSDREWSRLQTHPAEGWKMVQPMRAWLGEWARGTRDHHERWDGGGYPRGIKGHEISRAGRVIAVVDAFDVMTTVRAYKTAMTHDAARSELASCSGAQFDPEVVRAFLSASLVPKQRGKVGTWLANSPVALQFSGAANVPAAVTSAVAVALAAATVVVPLIDTEPEEFAAERIVEDRPGLPTVTSPITLTVAPSSTTTTTTTTTLLPSTTLPPTTAPVTTTTAAAPPPTRPPATTTSPSPTTTTTEAVVLEIPTTTTTTTTIPPSTFDGGYLGAGSGGSSFGLVSTVSGSGATNWDSGANADPGFTLTSGPSGLVELDAANVTTWVLPIAAETRLSGNASLRMYVATPDFGTDSLAGVVAGISSCPSLFGGCTTIGSGQIVFSQEPFGADFGVVTIDFGSVDHTLAEGEHLVVSMTVPLSMPTDTWIAFGTADYPSRFRLT